MKTFLALPCSSVSIIGGSLLTTLGVFLNSFKMCCLHYRHLSGDVTSWLDRAKENNGGRYSETHVENVKVLAKLFPLYGLQLLYRACITQVDNNESQNYIHVLTYVVLTDTFPADTLRLLHTDNELKPSPEQPPVAHWCHECDQHSAPAALSPADRVCHSMLPLHGKNSSGTCKSY